MASSTLITVASWADRLVGLIFSAFAFVPGIAAIVRNSAVKNANLAVHAREAGQPEVAIAYYERALRRAPREPEFHCEIGELLFEQDDSEKAAFHFQKALEGNYWDKRALIGLAHALHNQGEFVEAAFAYQRYLNLAPEDLYALINMGVVLHSADSTEDAIEYYTRAEKLAPDNALVYELRARALYSVSRYDLAIADLEKAIALEPDNSEAHRVLGQVWEAMGESKKALRSYDSAIRIDSANGDAQVDMARLLADEGRNHEAVEHGLLGVRSFEEQGETTKAAFAYWGLGWSYYELDDLEDSVAASQRALDLDPTLVEVRFNLGLALLASGKQQRAREEYDKATNYVTMMSQLRAAIRDLGAAVNKYGNLAGAQAIMDELEQQVSQGHFFSGRRSGR
jgi:tetratricopeptide (TPR) repeat protein